MHQSTAVRALLELSHGALHKGIDVLQSAELGSIGIHEAPCLFELVALEEDVEDSVGIEYEFHERREAELVDGVAEEKSLTHRLALLLERISQLRSRPYQQQLEVAGEVRVVGHRGSRHVGVAALQQHQFLIDVSTRTRRENSVLGCVFEDEHDVSHHRDEVEALLDRHPGGEQ